MQDNEFYLFQPAEEYLPIIEELTSKTLDSDKEYSSPAQEIKLRLVHAFDLLTMDKNGGRKRVTLSPLSPSSNGNLPKRRFMVTGTDDGKSNMYKGNPVLKENHHPNYASQSTLNPGLLYEMSCVIQSSRPSPMILDGKNNMNRGNIALPKENHHPNYALQSTLNPGIFYVSCTRIISTLHYECFITSRVRVFRSACSVFPLNVSSAERKQSNPSCESPGSS
ncbi:hypothetical protein DCAR_0519971 [Daucus carota subsp. sativus]|uniref:Uncharacterized protein n=1 Tax=Daucus carota subsp. sativus TaxID=79200 RepID=A0A175YC48_DAUCS|nr:hypothetical protein DCAR_0519971 [Daucus carota subsp. sativus]